MIDITKPIRTTDGQPVEIKITDARGTYPIRGYVGTDDYDLVAWTADGKYYLGGPSSDYDLVNYEPPQEVDLTMDDLPHGVELLSPVGARYTLLAADNLRVWVHGHSLTYSALRKFGWKWRADNGPWQPFSKTV